MGRSWGEWSNTPLQSDCGTYVVPVPLLPVSMPTIAILDLMLLLHQWPSDSSLAFPVLHWKTSVVLVLFNWSSKLALMTTEAKDTVKPLYTCIYFGLPILKPTLKMFLFFFLPVDWNFLLSPPLPDYEFSAQNYSVLLVYLRDSFLFTLSAHCPFYLFVTKVFKLTVFRFVFPSNCVWPTFPLLFIHQFLLL